MKLTELGTTEFDNFSFILAGGLKGQGKIDFAKLCDRIEHLKTVNVHHVAKLVIRLRSRCLDPEAYPCHILGKHDETRWNPLSVTIRSDFEVIPFLEAVARLLNTPRIFRLVIGRTLQAWDCLHGEIDFDQLISINVLRFAAPEAFSFLDRHRGRFQRPTPSAQNSADDPLVQIRRLLNEEWDNLTIAAEWDGEAARKVMESILPATLSWLEGARSDIDDPTQGVKEEKYWLRATSETIDPNDVRDQVVVCDIKDWLASHKTDSNLVKGICTSEAYCDAWENLAVIFLSNEPDEILRLCKEVLSKICTLHGAAAHYGSRGFAAVWRFAIRWSGQREENREWLKDRISEVALVSLQLTNDLWDDWGCYQGKFLRPKDCEDVRRHELQVLKECLTGESLCRVVNAQSPEVFYHLVFDPGNEKLHSLHGVDVWAWLGRVLLDALRLGNPTIEKGVAILVAKRDASANRWDPWKFDPNLLDGVFGDDAEEVSDILRRAAETYNDS